MIANFDRVGQPAPAHLFPPELDDDETALLDAFWELSSDRQQGAGVGPIPFASIDRWARRFAIDDPDDFGNFRRAIRAMDGELMTYMNEQAKSK